MSRLKTALAKAKDAFIKAMSLEDDETGEYTAIGIYEKGDVITTQLPNEVFLPDVVEHFALIRKINGKGVQCNMGLTAYRLKDVDCDIMPIQELETWEAILKNGFAECLEEKEDNALRFVLTSKYEIEPEVFDLLYEAYPDTDLKDILWKCERLEAVKWSLEHGADKHYDGLMAPMQDVIAYSHALEADDIFYYLYQCERTDYRRSLEEKKTEG